VKDCANWVVSVRKGITEARERLVLIHTELVATETARCVGKLPNDFLLHEGKPTGWDGAFAFTLADRWKRNGGM
jgi:hypothetical protein